MKPVIDLVAAGEKLEFTDARETTHGERSEVICTLRKGAVGPEAHIHIGQQEGFEVLSGELVVIVQGSPRTLGVGETLIVKSGEAHTFNNSSQTEPVVFKAWFEPALDTEWMLLEVGKLAMKRGGDWKKAPLVETGYILYKIRDQYRLAGIPFWAQDVLFGALNMVAHMTGRARNIEGP